jgi:hypothetical protein
MGICLVQAELFCSIYIHCFFSEKTLLNRQNVGEISNPPCTTFHYQNIYLFIYLFLLSMGNAMTTV